MIVVDASIAVKRFVRESDSDLARATWRDWTLRGEVLHAPALFQAETLSVVRRSVMRGVLSPEDGEDAFAVLQSMEVEILEPTGLYAQAWTIAREFGRPVIYDSCYVALARILECELWTADRRLYNAVNHRLPWVRLLGT